MRFAHCTFANVSFKEASIANSRFEDCTFLSRYFRKTELRSVAFVGCRFDACDFPKVRISSCDFKYSQFISCARAPSDISSRWRQWFDTEPTVSAYEWEEVEAMGRYGSLFLHHLRLEGQPLEETVRGRVRIVELLRGLCPYQLYRRDIAAFRQALDDVAEGIETGSTPEFELAVLGTVVRHASVLTCFLVGSPCFSREGAVSLACQQLGLDGLRAQGFQHLYRFKLSESGRCPRPFSPNWQDVREGLSRARDFIDRVHEIANVYETKRADVDSESERKGRRSGVCVSPAHAPATSDS